MAWQQAWRARVRLTPLARPPALVAGVDAICERQEDRIFGAAVLYSYPGLELLEEAGAVGPCPFSYRSGLLSFREAPILAAALSRLTRRPHLLLVDGQGIAHPRGLGLAAHLGVMLELPAIGVAKSRLVGQAQEPGPWGGAAAPLLYRRAQVGWLLRTQAGKKPFYVSPGQLVSLEDCLEVVMGCVRQYRTPIPLRQADRLSRRLRLQP
jgi:deoxyribonuclease V